MENTLNAWRKIGGYAYHLQIDDVTIGEVVTINGKSTAGVYRQREDLKALNKPLIEFFDNERAAQNWVEEQTGFTPELSGFAPGPHTPGRIQSLFFSGFIRIDVTDNRFTGLYDVEAYNLRVNRETPYSKAYAVDLETLKMVLQIFPPALEALKQDAADTLPQN